MSEKENARRQPLAGHWPSIRRQLVVVAAGLFLLWRLNKSRMDWDPEMRLWRAAGDTAFVLLWAALLIGPLIRLLPKLGPVQPYRRPLGMWSAIAAGYHLWLIWDGWALKSGSRLFGYEDVPVAQNETLNIVTDPGFGLANGMGLVAFSLMIPLVAVSSNWALRALGASAWARIQALSQTVFYLVAIHAAYYLFLHYELSLKSLVFRKGEPPANWFQELFVAMALGLIVLQLAAFIKQVQARRRGARQGSDAKLPPVN